MLSHMGHTHLHTHSNDSSSGQKNPIGDIANKFFFAVGVVLLLLLVLLALNNNWLVDLLQNDSSSYQIAEVIKTEKLSAEEIPLDAGIIAEQDSYRVEAELVTGEGAGETITAIADPFNSGLIDNNELRFSVGDELVFLETEADNYEIIEIYRLNWALIAIIVFIGLAALFAGKRGISSFVGLVATVFVLIGFIVPQIIAGRDPVLISLVGGTLVSVASIYLAHGFYKRTTLAVISTVGSILFAGVFASIFVELTNIFGLGSEEALFIQAGGLGDVNLKGILLGGIIIGTLGVLDDITTTQTATIEELHKADNKATFKELYKRGQTVGIEHISSLINTLVLAYAGASFPIFILLVANDQEPLWFTLNNEYFIEELVRAIVGSATLILAVPISTALAAWWYSREQN